MLSRDFLRLVLVAFIIAVLMAWYLLDNWLQDFAFHITMQWWMFALAGCTVLFIALSTVSYQSIKAANANPVKSLRTE
jgi:putative ABC transport system permease protein